MSEWIEWKGALNGPVPAAQPGTRYEGQCRNGAIVPDMFTADPVCQVVYWTNDRQSERDVVAFRIVSAVDDSKRSSQPEAPDPFKKYRDAASGGSTSYYVLQVDHPTSPDLEPYTCECQDVIEVLGMTFSEGEVFKALWRSCAARTLGLRKEGADVRGVRDAEKIVHFGQLILAGRGRK